MTTTSPVQQIDAAIADCALCGQPLTDAAVLARYRTNHRRLEATARASVRAELAAEAADRERARSVDRTKAAEAEAERRYEKRLRQMEAANHTLQQQLDVSKRRLEGLSPANRGRFHEDDLLGTLRAEFPQDRISAVRSGPARRPDIVHEILWMDAGLAKSAGVLVYECKDTARWDNAFVAQAEAARVRHHAIRAVIVTKTLPAQSTGFTLVGDTAIVDAAGMVPLARVLRAGIVQMASLRLTSTERAVRGAALMRYVASDEFTVTFASVRAAAVEVQAALMDERGWHDRVWAKRDLSYRRIATGLAEIDEGITAALHRAPAVDVESTDVPRTPPAALSVVPVLPKEPATAEPVAS